MILEMISAPYSKKIIRKTLNKFIGMNSFYNVRNLSLYKKKNLLKNLKCNVNTARFSQTESPSDSRSES